MDSLLILTALLAAASTGLLLVLLFRKSAATDPELRQKLDQAQEQLRALETALRAEFRTGREETAAQLRDNRTELTAGLAQFRTELQQMLTQQNAQNLTQLRDSAADQSRRLDALKTELQNLTLKTVEQMGNVSLRVGQHLEKLTEQAKTDAQLQRESLDKALERFSGTTDKAISAFAEQQKQQFETLEQRQGHLVEQTEKKLESIRVTVEEKLEKTLSDRLGQSFETVGKQLLEVQRGLGEMQTLAADVGGLKRVLTNVKTRGGIGEVQLQMLLEQVLAPEQFEANVRTKSGSADLVEFAIKLPGRDDANRPVWLPVDAKFPKDVYEQLQEAYESADQPRIDAAQKQLEATIKKMAKDIADKYLDPPNTTDFGILFLPFEGMYAEVVRRSALLEELQRTYKIIITGPTTLAAILNSLQMGFKTLAIQKRSSEVWQVLGAVKTEFSKFGGLLDQAQKKIQGGLDTIEEMRGKRTRAIERKLRDVQSISPADAGTMLELGSGESGEEEE